MNTWIHYYFHVHLQVVSDTDPDCSLLFFLQQILFPQFMERELWSEYCLTQFAYSSCLCKAGISILLLTSGAARNVTLHLCSYKFQLCPGHLATNLASLREMSSHHSALSLDLPPGLEKKQQRPEPHFVTTHFLTIKPLMANSLRSKVEALDFPTTATLHWPSDFVSVLGIGSEFNLS